VDVCTGVVYPLQRGVAWMCVMIRDQHVSARTRVYLAAEGALLSAHTCVCLAAGDALAANKMACLNHAIFFAFCTYICAVHSFRVGEQGWGSSASL